MKFRADANGFISAVRFYKTGLNTGQHIAHLWTSTGTLLATATFNSETPTGWQQATLSNPVPVTAGTIYVASYHTNQGHVSADPLYFDDWPTTNSRGPRHPAAACALVA